MIGFNFADIKWDSATDNVGVVGYEVFFSDDTFVASVGNVNRYRFLGLMANTEYSVYLVALDAQGNRSANSGILTFRTKTGGATFPNHCLHSTGGVSGHNWDLAEPLLLDCILFKT